MRTLKLNQKHSVVMFDNTDFLSILSKKIQAGCNNTDLIPILNIPNVSGKSKKAVRFKS